MIPRILWRDCRKLGAGKRSDRYCRKGVKAFCDKHGISFDKLFDEGVPITEVAHLNDLYVKRLIQAATEREDERK